MGDNEEEKKDKKEVREGQVILAKEEWKKEIKGEREEENRIATSNEKKCLIKNSNNHVGKQSNNK